MESVIAQQYCLQCGKVARTEMSSCLDDKMPLISVAAIDRLNQLSLVGCPRRNLQSMDCRAVDAYGSSVLVKIFNTRHWTVEHQQAFKAEFKALTGLIHENIGAVLVHDVESVNPYVVYDCAGQTMRDALKQEGSITPSRCGELFSGLMDALSYAHDKGVFHRDIRPENILLQDGAVKLIGFDCASPHYSEAHPGTCTRLMSNESIYSNPELLKMKECSASSEVYSLAVVIFEALTGMPPFIGDSAAETAVQHMTMDPPPFSKCSSALEFLVHLQTVIFRALAKDESQRYAGMREFKQAFLAAVSASGVRDDCQPIQVGSFVDDKYRVVSHIENGGMGSVFLAHDERLDRPVVVKCLLPNLLGDKEDRSRFKREGMILADLKHPNVVQFFSFGIWNNRYPYIIMEHLRGHSLRYLIRTEERLSISRALQIGLQICAGMEIVHEHGIVHRDLKPNNIVIDGDGHAKVVDFGLARILSNSKISVTHHLTRTGLLIGSVYYMSPEQCMGQKADARADIYSLGCILYETVTGRMPFFADNPVGLLQKHIAEDPAPLGLEDPAASSLESVLFKAMAKEPVERYQSMSELKHDLQLVMEGKQVSVKPRKLAKPCEYFYSEERIDDRRDLVVRLRQKYPSFGILSQGLMTLEEFCSEHRTSSDVKLFFSRGVHKFYLRPCMDQHW